MGLLWNIYTYPSKNRMELIFYQKNLIACEINKSSKDVNMEVLMPSSIFIESSTLVNSFISSLCSDIPKKFLS